MATATIDEFPRRDPRTAYGRAGRIPVPQVTELSSMPPEFAQQATRPAAAAGIEAPAAPASRMARFGRALGPVGAALGGAAEAVDIGRVAANRRSTGADVATQAAEGVGRLASAGAGAVGGAKLGALAAPFLGPAAPIAPVVGGLAGGAFGYFAGDQAIRGGRAALGADPASPVDRLATLPAQPAILPGNSAAGDGRGSVNPARVDPTQPPPLAPSALEQNTIVRDGNSYSGADISEGAQIRTPSGALRGTYGVSSLGGGAEVRGIEDRTRGFNAATAQAQRSLDAYGPGPSGGGAGGFGGETLSSAANKRFNDTPSLSVLPAAGQSMKQFAEQRFAEREGQRQRAVTERGQDLGLLAQAAETDTRRGATRATLDIANIGAGTQRDVARIGASARTTAAETAANARAAAAESAAKRYTVVPGGQEVVDSPTGPVTIKRPDRVFENAAGKFLDAPAAGGGNAAAAPTPRAEYSKMPKGARYVGPDGQTYFKG